jgi:hypothetical protein
MARNDIVLLDSIVEKAKAQFGSNRDDSEVFELFCFDQVLKDFDLSFEEIETGWTDGTDDGGIDGFFVFVDGHLITDTDLSFVSKRNPEVSVELFTVKRSDSFKQDALNSVYSSIAELLDLTKSEAEFAYPFREEVLEQRRLLRHVMISLADRRPLLIFRTHYCSRGDSTSLSNNLTSRADLIRDTILDLFGDAQVEVNFVGASELLTIARRQQNYSLRLKFIESYISREGGNYVILASLPSYFEFITDEEGKLRRYLFESNVRDYLGAVQINQDIRGTLNSKKNASEEDFWWLNNGVTILATHANVVGKEISIENVQIVNGLQTTETIYEFYTNNGLFEDNRAILIKILLAADEQTRARIIKATNYQNTVELSSLRGLDTIQRDIEQFLFDHGWYYDRRKNYYKNQGRPAERIISIPYLAAAVRAVALRDPASSQRQRSRSLRDDDVYNQVFSSKWDLNIYLACLEITQAVESVIQSKRKINQTPPITLVHYIAFVYTCDKLGRPNFQPQDVASLAGAPPTISEVIAIRSDLEIASRYPGVSEKKYGGIALSKSFIENFMRHRFPGIETRVFKNVDSLDQSIDVPSTEASPFSEEILAAYEEAKHVGTPREIINKAYDVLKKAVDLLSPKTGPRVGIQRTLLNAAIERGVTKNIAERALTNIFILKRKTRNELAAISDEDAEAFLRAISKMLQCIGVKVEL